MTPMMPPMIGGYLPSRGGQGWGGMNPQLLMRMLQRFQPGGRARTGPGYRGMPGFTQPRRMPGMNPGFPPQVPGRGFGRGSPYDVYGNPRMGGYPGLLPNMGRMWGRPNDMIRMPQQPGYRGTAVSSMPTQMPGMGGMGGGMPQGRGLIEQLGGLSPAMGVKQRPMGIY